MEMHSTRPSSVMENGTELDTNEVEWNPDQIEWNEEISLKEAKALLEKAMYPFKKVPPSLPSSPNLSILNTVRWSTGHSWRLLNLLR